MQKGVMAFSDEELEKYGTKYDLLSKEELQKWAVVSEATIVRGVRFKDFFEMKAEIIQGKRERERQHGVGAVRTQPLVHVLCATVASEDESLALYGSIRAEYDDGEHELFKCESDAPQFIGTSGILPLKGPDFRCEVSDGRICLESNIVVQLFDQTGKEYADQEFMVDDQSDEAFEVVVSKSIPCERGTLTLRYIVIPHGVSSRIDINVVRRGFPEKGSSFDVSGRIVVKYANTWEDFVLFDKQGEESERVLVDNRGELRLLRCWVALSAHSVLHVDVDLKISGTDHKIAGTVKLNPEQGWGSNEAVVGDDYVVSMNAAWFSPRSYRVPYIEPKRASLHPYPALEIFSVWICREKWTEPSSRVYGSIIAQLGDHSICSIFKRDSEDAFPSASAGMICIPVSYGCRKFGGSCESLDIKLDIKDVDNSLAIKGTVEWDAIILQRYHDNMHCSVFRGHNGYAAVHYAVFPNAVEASIRVYHLLTRGEARSLPPSSMFEGTVKAEYGEYVYPTKHDKRYYPIELLGHARLERTHDPVCKIQLSRSRIVVPSPSYLHLTLDLVLVSDQHVVLGCYFDVAKIKIGQKEMMVADGNLHIEVDWREIEGRRQ